MRIAMIGSGYVGLVSGACLSDFGHDVVCVDHDAQRIATLKSGQMPIFEPGLDGLVHRNRAAGRLSFTTDVGRAVRGADVVFLAVGTPARPGDGHADLSFLLAAAREVARALGEFTVVAIKSTVPVGTGDEVAHIIGEIADKARCAVVSNPEFLREGSAIEDFCRPDRVIIGLEDERARPLMEAVYRPLYLNRAPLVFTTRRTAELTKYAANAFLAMKISFINEIADLCERSGADVQDVARGMGLDGRIGSKFLHAGPGYGGSCFPKDTVALARTGSDHCVPLRLVEATIAINEQRKRSMGARIIAAFEGQVRGRTIAVLGLTFKPNTDDMREAPSIPIIEDLLAAGASIRAHDPEGMDNARRLFPGIEYATDAYAACAGADGVVLVTEWNALRSLDLARLSSVMAGTIFVDLRNVYRPTEVEAHGFIYRGVGRGSVWGSGRGTLAAE